jgi:hypothetical protein
MCLPFARCLDCVFLTKTTEGGKTDVTDVGGLEWDHVTSLMSQRGVQGFEHLHDVSWVAKTTSASPKRSASGKWEQCLA